MKIILIDERERFLDDIQTRLLLDDHDIEICATLTSTEKLNEMINTYDPEYVVICENTLEQEEDWDFGDVEVLGYALTEDGKIEFNANHIPCYGIVKTSTHLLNLLEGDVPALETTPKKKTSNNKKSSNTNAKKKSNNSTPKKAVPHKKTVKPKPVEEVVEDEEDYEEDYENDEELYDDEYDEDIEEDFDEDVDDEEEEEYEEVVIRKPVHKKAVAHKSTNSPNRNSNNAHKKPVAKKSQMELLREKKKREYEDTTGHEFTEDELYTKKAPAKTVATYAAKGGVGKTTVASNIAVYLALTSHGRGRYKVCIVDYNIDFGDVRSTLGLDNSGVDMCEWAADIRDRMENGEEPDDIQYSQKEIEGYLQIMENVGLYALCAPNTHEESMDIGPNELKVMLRNVIENGDFDFVVCDTGNNTRDSSYCALEAADNVLLVVTQDVNSASCNKSAMETFKAVGFDLSKIRLIVNNIVSTKYTGVQTKDVEDYFNEFPCIARIKHDMAIVRANNFSQPIVLNPEHPATKELQHVIAFLTGNSNGETEEPQKPSGIKSFFSKIFGN